MTAGNEEAAGLSVAISLSAGIAATLIARHLSVPGIVLLLGAGVLLGPEVAGLVQPSSLGSALHTVVGFAVAVILFEGGMSLDVGRLRREARVIQLLIFGGAVVTTVGGAAGALLFLGWEPRLAILFGTLVIVTGPTVVTPLLRRINVNRNVQTILEAEGVFGDAVGALVAVMTLEVILADTGYSMVSGVASLPLRVGIGSAVGLAGGGLLALLFRRDRWVPEGLENVLTLSLALLSFQVSNTLAPESGILAAIVAGVVVGNFAPHRKRELMHFKEQLTVLFIGMIFILLAADVRVQEIVDLGWPGLACVGFLIAVVRPALVVAATWRSNVSFRERAFVSWLAPRGIVAAAVSSLFAHQLDAAGIAGGSQLRALVFLVIAVTVVVQGMSGGVVAGLLGVRRKKDDGYLVVGANPIGRAVARALSAAGEPVVLVDANPHSCRAAEEEGLRVIFGNALQERTLLRAEAESRRGAVVATANEGVNLLVARKLREEFNLRRTFAAVNRARIGVTDADVHEAGASVLFGSARDLELWNSRLGARGAPAIECWKLTRSAAVSGEAAFALPDDILPLASARGTTVAPVGEGLPPVASDRLWLVSLPERQGAAHAWLRAQGWEPVVAPPAQAPEPIPSAATS